MIFSRIKNYLTKEFELMISLNKTLKNALDFLPIIQ